MMNSNLKTVKPKKNYEGLYVSNLEEDFESDIFALHNSEADRRDVKKGSTTKNTRNGLAYKDPLRGRGIDPLKSRGIDPLKDRGVDSLKSTTTSRSQTEQVKVSSDSSALKSCLNLSPNSSNPSSPSSQTDAKTQNDGSSGTSFSQPTSLGITNRQNDTHKIDAGRQNFINSKPMNQRKPAPTVQIATRSHVTPRKVDVKGFGHETQDLVLQNLDDEF